MSETFAEWARNQPPYMIRQPQQLRVGMTLSEAVDAESVKGMVVSCSTFILRVDIYT
jgi:hypothetical protein